MPRPTVGFFGLGTMGAPIASRLARAGYAVAVADPRTAATSEWRTRHPKVQHDPRDADVLITCVTDEATLEPLLFDPTGLLAHTRPGTILIDHTTTSPRLARRAAQTALANGARFVDAPLSGGAASAEAGTLSVFAGGSADALTQASVLMQHYAQRITRLGDTGAGQTGKLANQLAIAGTVRGLSEAVALGRDAGLDIEALLGALSAGSARSNQLEQHATKLAAPSFDFAATFAWLEKDLELALDEVQDSASTLPQAGLIQRLLRS